MLDLLFNKLFPFIRPYKAKVIGAILLSFCLAAIGGLQVSLVKPLFDQGLSPESSREEVYLLAAKLLGLGLLNFPCRFLLLFLDLIGNLIVIHLVNQDQVKTDYL